MSGFDETKICLLLHKLRHFPVQVTTPLIETFAQQEARQQTARANLDRIKPLAAHNAVAQKDLDDALGTFQSAAAAVEAEEGR